MSQVFMAEINAPSQGNDGRVENPSAHQDTPTTSGSGGPTNAAARVVQLGEPGTIPKKVPASNQQPKQPPGPGTQPSGNRKQAPAAQTAAPTREKIVLSAESMALVKEAVRLGRLLPIDATRDELTAYTKLAGEQTQRLRREIEVQEERERRSSRRQHAKSSRSSPPRDKSKINKLRKTEREKVIRKLDDDFRLEEDDDDDEEPLTPAEALVSAQDYLSRAQ